MDILAGLSLLLAITSLIAWASTFFTRDRFAVVTLTHIHKSDIEIFLGPSSFGIRVVHWLDTADERESFRQEYSTAVRSGVPICSEHHFLGFTYARGDSGVWGANGLKWAGHIIFFVVVPTAIEIPVLFLFPFVRWRRTLIHRRRRTKGLCQSCGYDLRATPNRCPECGTIPAPAAKNPAGARRLFNQF